VLLFFYILPLILQLFIRNEKKVFIYLINFFSIIVVAVVHYLNIEAELDRTHFKCGIALIAPFFCLFLSEILLLIIFLIQFFLAKRNNKTNHVNSQ
jgi:hypothetical protein